MQTFELHDGGILFYDGAFLPADHADRYFDDLRQNSAWEQKPGIFGHMQPRLIASYGDDGITYRYSGSDYSALPWTPTLLEIKARIEEVYGNYNYCLLNLYRNGRDSMGMHADNEPEMGYQEVQHQAQQDQGDPALFLASRIAAHHGWNDAAVLET
jgi:hypothetical protein